MSQSSMRNVRAALSISSAARPRGASLNTARRRTSRHRALWGTVATVLCAACGAGPDESSQDTASTVTSLCTTNPSAPGCNHGRLFRRTRGDVDGDGRADVALTGGFLPCTSTPWQSIPVAFSKGNGTFRVTNAAAPDFAGWSVLGSDTGPLQGALPVMGDFDGDGRADVALTHGPNWLSIPVAFSNGNGAFHVTNTTVQDFPTWSAVINNGFAVAGDFDGDGRDDLAVTGNASSNSIPVAFSNGDGSFRVTNNVQADFASWAALPQAELLAGDFNGDGRGDLALTGGLYPDGSGNWLPWESIPVALSNGDGTFTVTNAAVPDFPHWSTATDLGLLGARGGAVTGDFDGDGRADIALVRGVTAWRSIPIAFSNGDGTFHVTNKTVNDFPQFAPYARQVLAGDVDGDHRDDLMLTGGTSWASLPVAFSNGDGTFRVTNETITDFATFANSWTLTPSPQVQAALTVSASQSAVPVAAASSACAAPLETPPMGSLVVTAPTDVPVTTSGFGGWVDVPGLKTQVRTAQGDAMTMTVSAEVITSKPVWVRALVDGIPTQDVLFKSGSDNSDGTRSYTFVRDNMAAGSHIVAIQWIVNAGDSAQFGNRTLSVDRASPSSGSARMAVVTPASGANVVKTTATWEDIPGLATTIVTNANAGGDTLRISASAEAIADSGILYVRALVDGTSVADVVFDNAGNQTHAGTRSYVFIKPNTGAGPHTVKLQWSAQGSGAQVELGDRTLAVTSVPSSMTGGGMWAGGAEAAPTTITSTSEIDIPNVAGAVFYANDPSSDVELTFASEVRTANGRLFLRALVDDAPVSPGTVTYVGSGDSWRAQAYTFVLKNVPGGLHRLTFRASVDAGATARIGDRFATATFKRRIGADFAQPYQSLNPKSPFGPPTVVIGFDPHYPGTTEPTMRDLMNIFRGDDFGPSVAGWYTESSGGNFVPNAFTFLGWYDAPADRQGTWYWDNTAYDKMIGDALTTASATFNFAAYDANNDNYIDPNELLVAVVRPSVRPDGFLRYYGPYALNGANLQFRLLDVYLSPDPAYRVEDVGVSSHEGAHGMLGTVDLYSGYATDPGYYSIMSQHYHATGLDPFDQMKSGFVTPDVVEINALTTTNQTLTAVQIQHRITVIYDPAKKDREYFILQNRYFGYDANLVSPGPGVTLWHIVEDTNLQAQFPPPGSDPNPNWGRLGVRFKGVLIAAGQSAELLWADGTSSKVRVTMNSPPGLSVNVTLDRLP
jgi:M6 family metalloprotease-like protein